MPPAVLPAADVLAECSNLVPSARLAAAREVEALNISNQNLAVPALCVILMYWASKELLTERFGGQGPGPDNDGVRDE